MLSWPLYAKPADFNKLLTCRPPFGDTGAVSLQEVVSLFCLQFFLFKYLYLTPLGVMLSSTLNGMFTGCLSPYCWVGLADCVWSLENLREIFSITFTFFCFVTNLIFFCGMYVLLRKTSYLSWTFWQFLDFVSCCS